MSLENAKIVLTGGTGGIGRHLAGAPVNGGAALVVVSRSEPSIDGVQQLAADLSSLNEIERVARQTAAWQPDILINLAGDQYFGPFEQQAADDVNSSFCLNLIAPTILTQNILPGMKERGCGHIVNVGSIFGSINYPHFVTYSVAKAGLYALSQALRRELDDSGVHVTYVAPRAVEAGLNKGAVARFVEMTKMAVDTPEHVAQRIVKAIRNKERDVFIGQPEKLFVWMNAMAPALVDLGLAQQTRKARELLQSDLFGGR